MFKRKINQRYKKDIIEDFEKELFKRIVDECIESATEFTSIKISRVIEFHISFVQINFKKYEYNEDTTIIKIKHYTYRDLAHLIVEKENLIEFIKSNFVKE